MSGATVNDDDIVAMLNAGASNAAIKSALKVGNTRIAKLRRELAGEPERVADDVEEGPETVVVSAEYLRALEAVVYLVEQNQRLHLAVANG